MTAALAAAVCAAACTPSARSLDERLAACLDTIPARVGVFVCADDGFESGYRADDELPMLSTFKFPVALTVIDKMRRTGANFSDSVHVAAEQILPDTYSPMREQRGQRDMTLTLGELIAYCVSASDNNACDILIDYAGGIDSVGSYVRRTGVAPMRIAATEQTMHTRIDRQRDNVASPRAAARMLELFRNGALIAPPYRDTLMRYMIETSTGPDKLRAGLPATATLAHKTGSSDRTPQGVKVADNDIGIVTLPDGRSYCIAVFVCDSPADDRTNAAIAARISKMVYDHIAAAIGR